MNVADTGGRIVGLDSWRALLMLAGLFVHGSIWLGAHPLFTLINMLSQSFRMGVFFAISGFLGARVLMRRGAKRWLRERMVQLAIPALFGLSMLSPIMWLVAIDRVGPGEPMPLWFDWHHLWFLYGLMFYAAVTVSAFRIARGSHWPARAERWIARSDGRARCAMFALALLSAALMTVAQWLLRTTLSPRYLAVFYRIDLILGYLPMFLLGSAMAARAPLCERMLASRGIYPVLAAVAAGCVVAVLWRPQVSADAAARIDGVTRFVGASVGPPFAFVAVLRSAFAITRVGPALRALSDASYTIYLLHLPAVSIVNAVVVRSAVGSGWHPVAVFAGSIVLAVSGCYLFHVLVVRRVASVALLINGRVPQRRHLPVLAAAH